MWSYYKLWKEFKWKLLLSKFLYKWKKKRQHQSNPAFIHLPSSEINVNRQWMSFMSVESSAGACLHKKMVWNCKQPTKSLLSRPKPQQECSGIDFVIFLLPDEQRELRARGTMRQSRRWMRNASGCNWVPLYLLRVNRETWQCHKHKGGGGHLMVLLWIVGHSLDLLRQRHHL